MTEKEKDVLVEQLLIDFRNRGSNLKCYHSDCIRKANLNHTIQNSYILDVLSESGHVFMILPSRDGIVFDKISRNKASTFSGFCQNHDTEFFSKIDIRKGNDFNLNEENMILLAYRSLLKEYFSKLMGISHFENMVKIWKTRDLEKLNKVSPFTKKFGKNFPFEEIDVVTLEATLEGLKMALDDFKPFESIILDAIKSGDYSKTQNFRLSFEKEIEWACSSASSPSHYFNNKATVNNFNTDHINIIGVIDQHKIFNNLDYSFKNKDFKFLILNIIPLNNKTEIIFTSLKKDEDFSRPFIDFLKNSNEQQKQKYLSMFIILNCENIVFKPSYINKFSKTRKNEILEVFQGSTISHYPYSNLKINFFI